MRIGVLTLFHSKDNYGQQLQCYALQKYLRDMGHDVFLIRYDYLKDLSSPLWLKMLKAFNPIKLVRYAMYKRYHANVLKEQSRNDRCFDSFREKHVIMSERQYGSYVELCENPPPADAYIVGSDQVWNCLLHCSASRVKTQIHAFFLDFGGPDAKRISYAASWGMESIPRDHTQEIEPLLAKFDYVSVREKSGIELCRQCGRDDAEWVCDPTLLLPAESYRNLYREEDRRGSIRKPKSKYLLLYMLKDERNFDKDSVYAFATTKKLEVVYVTGGKLMDGREKFFATIPEWLYLVDNAEYVITNSFHGSVFSTIFHKAFGVIPREGKFAGMNTRLESLFALRGMEKRYVTDKNFSILDVPYDMEDMHVSEDFILALSNNHIHLTGGGGKPS